MPRRILKLLAWLFSFLITGVAQAGYNHDFTWKIDPSNVRVAQCVEEMKLLIHARQQILEVVPPDPKYLGGDAIRFNGIGDDQCEDFVFPGSTVSHNLNFTGTIPPILIGFNPCKTNWKPYDEVVTACLLVARDHFTDRELKIVSDGDWDDGWQAGRKLYEDTLGRTARNPMSPSVVDVPPFKAPVQRHVLVVVFVIAMLFFVKRILRGRQRG
jgi:hypothetical protein